MSNYIYLDTNVKTDNICCVYICNRIFFGLVCGQINSCLFFRLLVLNVVHLFVNNCIGYTMAYDNLASKNPVNFESGFPSETS